MSENSISTGSPRPTMVEAVNILRSCQPVSKHLMEQGVTVELSDKERACMLAFERLELSSFSDSEWSYLRVASGIQVSALAALRGCLTYYRSNGLKMTDSQTK